MDAQGYLALILLSIVLLFGPMHSCSQRHQEGTQRVPFAVPAIPAPHPMEQPEPDASRDFRAQKKLTDEDF